MIIEQLQKLQENQGKTIVSNGKLSGGRKAVYWCDSPGCKYSETFSNHNIPSIINAAVANGAEEQHVSLRRIVVDSWCVEAK